MPDLNKPSNTLPAIKHIKHCALPTNNQKQTACHKTNACQKQTKS